MSRNFIFALFLLLLTTPTSILLADDDPPPDTYNSTTETTDNNSNSSSDYTTTRNTQSTSSTDGTIGIVATDATTDDTPQVANAITLGPDSIPSDTPLPDLFTGTMSYKIPIKLPPGRKGITPGLSITYKSTNGNGWLGVGWELTVGSIERNTRFGVDVS